MRISLEQRAFYFSKNNVLFSNKRNKKKYFFSKKHFYYHHNPLLTKQYQRCLQKLHYLHYGLLTLLTIQYNTLLFLHVKNKITLLHYAKKYIYAFTCIPIYTCTYLYIYMYTYIFKKLEQNDFADISCLLKTLCQGN